MEPMQKNHLAFSRPQAPPPPVFATSPLSASLEAAPSPEKRPKKKPKRSADTHGIGSGSDGPERQPVSKKQRVADQRVAECSANRGEDTSARQPAQKHRGSNSAAASTPLANAASSRPSSSASVGMDTGHVLLVLGLPSGATELQLQQHFASCAPLQAGMLHDWSTGQPRGAACLAVASARAANLALQPSLAEFGGVRIRVCAATSSGASEDGFGGTLSAAMRKQLAALETKAISSSGAAVPQGVLRHLLLCCDHTAAAAAVEEFCAVTRSGKPKQPGALLTMTVLKHRQMGGGAVWLGRVSGKPLPAAPASRLRALLDALDWGAMPADGKLRGEMAEQSFKLGLSTRAWGKQNGPYKPFAFKAAMGVWDAASVTRKHQELWDAASALIAAADPGYYWTSVQFNKNFRASRHRDDKDASYQVATAFGDYEGGELRVHGQEGILDVNTRDRFVRFDGRFEHEVRAATARSLRGSSACSPHECLASCSTAACAVHAARASGAPVLGAALLGHLLPAGTAVVRRPEHHGGGRRGGWAEPVVVTCALAATQHTERRTMVGRRNADANWERHGHW